MAKETEDHRKKIEVVNSSIDQKKREIRQIIEENVEIIAQINTDTKFELEDIQSKNEKNLLQVQEMKLKSKAEIDLTKNKHDDINKDIGTMEREQADMGHKITHQNAQVNEKEAIIANTILSIRAKDDSIA
jgi:hypothetical protein